MYSLFYKYTYIQMYAIFFSYTGANPLASAADDDGADAGAVQGCTPGPHQVPRAIQADIVSNLIDLRSNRASLVFYAVTMLPFLSGLWDVFNTQLERNQFDSHSFKA